MIVKGICLPSFWRRTIMVAALFLGSFCQNAVAQVDSVDLFLQKIMQERSIPGMQVVVVRHGKIVKSGAYGVSNLEYKTPVTPETIFTFNSITKSFTGVALMQLVEEGKLDLDAAIGAYLPNLPEAWRSVKVKRLASNTSGLPNVLDPVTGEWVFQNVGDAKWEKFLAQPMEFETGEKFSYNQTGFVLLGQLIDKLSGKPFQEMIKERQLVAMPHSGFGDFYDVVSGMAKSYTYSNQKFRNVAEIFPPAGRTAAGMYGTAEELAHWTIALQEGKLLKKESSLATLWTPVPLNSGNLGGFSRLLNGYAIGWPTMSRPEHPAVGGIGGGRSAFFIYPDDDLTLVVLTNRLGCAPESFIDELASFYIPSMKPSTGFGLPPEIRLLHHEFTKRNFQKVEQVVKSLRKKNPVFIIPEDDLNAWGYQLWEQGHLDRALTVFKLNTTLYPNSGNVYDSYAEALMSKGEKELAIKNYKRSLALSPNNAGAIKQLKILEGK